MTNKYLQSGIGLGASLALATVGVGSAEAQVGSGTLTGTFENPVLESSAQVSGVGTNDFTFGSPDFGSQASRLTFQPFNFTNQPEGATFVAGLLSYRNGETFIGTAISAVDLQIKTSSIDPGFTQTFVESLGFIITPNVNVDPALNADAVFFINRPELGSFFVNENEETSIEILAKFDSSELEVVGLGNVGNPATGSFSPGSQPVPEPLTLLGASAAVAFGAKFKRRKSGNN